MRVLLDIFLSALVVGVGTVIARRANADMPKFPHGPTTDFEWLPNILEDPDESFILPEGWKRGNRYACIAVHVNRNGKTTYACRQL